MVGRYANGARAVHTMEPRPYTGLLALSRGYGWVDAGSHAMNAHLSRAAMRSNGDVAHNCGVPSYEHRIFTE